MTEVAIFLIYVVELCALCVAAAGLGWLAHKLGVI